MSKKILLVIDEDAIERYTKYYFDMHPKAYKAPIPHPYHESINTWMIMKRPMMNALKGRWKDFMCYFVEEQGYANLHIEQCEIYQTIYFPNHRRHDPDNYTPKFMMDGLVASGMLVDDDSEHVTKLTLQCFTDTEHPRTELLFKLPNKQKAKELKEG